MPEGKGLMETKVLVVIMQSTEMYQLQTYTQILQAEQMLVINS